LKEKVKKISCSRRDSNPSSFHQADALTTRAQYDLANGDLEVVFTLHMCYVTTLWDGARPGSLLRRLECKSRGMVV